MNTHNILLVPTILYCVCILYVRVYTLYFTYSAYNNYYTVYVHCKMFLFSGYAGSWNSLVQTLFCTMCCVPCQLFYAAVRCLNKKPFEAEDTFTDGWKTCFVLRRKRLVVFGNLYNVIHVHVYWNLSIVTTHWTKQSGCFREGSNFRAGYFLCVIPVGVLDSTYCLYMCMYSETCLYKRLFLKQVI